MKFVPTSAQLKIIRLASEYYNIDEETVFKIITESLKNHLYSRFVVVEKLKKRGSYETEKKRLDRQ